MEVTFSENSLFMSIYAMCLCTNVCMYVCMYVIRIRTHIHCVFCTKKVAGTLSQGVENPIGLDSSSPLIRLNPPNPIKIF